MFDMESYHSYNRNNNIFSDKQDKDNQGLNNQNDGDQCSCSKINSIKINLGLCKTNSTDESVIFNLSKLKEFNIGILHGFKLSKENLSQVTRIDLIISDHLVKTIKKLTDETFPENIKVSDFIEKLDYFLVFANKIAFKIYGTFEQVDLELECSIMTDELCSKINNSDMTTIDLDQEVIKIINSNYFCESWSRYKLTKVNIKHVNQNGPGLQSTKSEITSVDICFEPNRNKIFTLWPPAMKFKRDNSITIDIPEGLNKYNGLNFTFVFNGLPENTNYQITETRSNQLLIYRGFYVLKFSS